MVLGFRKIVRKVRTWLRWVTRKRGFKAWGANSYIKKPFRVIGRRFIVIGSGVSILDRARIEVYSSKVGIAPELLIQDGVSIEQNLHLIVLDKMIIGKHTTVSSNVYIANCCHSYAKRNVDVLEQELLFRETRIGEYCFVGYGAAILPGACLGNNCIVGANAVVPPGEYGNDVVLAGNPAKVIKRFNEEKSKWERVWH